MSSTSFSDRIDNLAYKYQWPVMQDSLHKVIKWRNEDSPNNVKRYFTSAACIGIALITVIASITKVALGTILLIPPFTHLGGNLMASSLYFEPQVFSSCINTASDSLHQLKVKEFRLDLI